MYRQYYSTKNTPQTQQIPGSKEVKNSADGFSFPVDDWKRLQRFLVLGSESASYYASAQTLTVENAEAVRRCIAENGKRVVDEVVAISDSGRAPKNDSALFVLAMASSFGNEETRRYALNNLPKVARIATHLFHFAQYVEGFRGWGRGLKRAVGNWYLSKYPEDVAFQAIKYQQRDGWSHRDMLRLSHPSPDTASKDAVFQWITRHTIPSDSGDNKASDLIHAFEEVQKAETTEARTTELINEFNFSWEMIPADKRTNKVWEALLPHLGLTALLRNLGVLSKNGVIAQGKFDTIKLIRERFLSEQNLQKARIHPIAILSALRTYSSGHGVRGHNTWEVVPDIVEMLNDAFYLSFKNVKPTGKNIMLALDVSGSMGMGEIAGVPGLTPREAAAAMAMVTYKAERNVVVKAFAHEFIDLNISRAKSLEDVVKATSSLDFGGTDCSLPMYWALDNKVDIDAFVCLTDSETWAGKRGHPVQALREYRRTMNKPHAKLIVVGMVSNGFSIADPDDSGMMDVIGFDSAAPQIISDFIADRV